MHESWRPSSVGLIMKEKTGTSTKTEVKKPKFIHLYEVNIEVKI